MSVISKEPDSIIAWKQGKWGPKGSFPYRVRYGENWWKIAAKDGWTDVWGFIDYNFRTKNAAEVNWYLRHFVGCTLVAPDGKNLCFSDDLKPGIIYTKHQLQAELPPPVYPIPMPTPTGADDVDKPEPGEVLPNGTWVGLGVKVGGMAGPVGAEGVSCTLLASNRPELQVQAVVTTYREGWGLGLSGGAVLVVVTGVHSASKFRGLSLKNPDWSLALGVKLGFLGKLARKLPNLASIISEAARGVEFGASGADTTINALKGLAAAAAITFDPNKPSCTVIDLPLLGGGVEVSKYIGYSTFSVLKIRHGWRDDVVLQSHPVPVH